MKVKSVDRLLFNLLFCLLLMFIFTSAQGGNLPDEVYLKSPSQGFSYEYQYALKDGKIWIKPNTKHTGKVGQWELFEQTGLPKGLDVPSFRDTDIVSEFSTEATMIVAASKSGRLYFWQPTLKEQTNWAEKNGAPFEDALYLPKHKRWCFAMSLMRAPWKRLTPMHENDIVSYWEDIDGNRTDFGFTATIYSVDPGGQRIRYTDTGLPTSWHKAFSSPERGRVIIDEISASASTLFVTDKYGNMYTRMMDYELLGGCPALKFVYERAKRTQGEESVPIMKAVRTLPLPTWQKQEPIRQVLEDKQGLAVITNRITILLTGKGNAARELRVQGRNSEGEYGYWYKAIFASEWNFVKTNETFPDSLIIHNYLSKTDYGRVLDKNYSGRLHKRRLKAIKAQLIGFYYYSTPCTLRIFYDDKYFDLVFHTVDMWGPTVQFKNYPELVGNQSGEPKLLKGTLEIPKSILETNDSDIRGIIDTWFKEYNLVPFAFSVWADDNKVNIESRRIQRDIKNHFWYKLRPRLSMNFKHEPQADELRLDTFYTAIANNRTLILSADTMLNNLDLARLDNLIRLNEKALAQMQALLKQFKQEHIDAYQLNQLASFTYDIFNGVISVIGLPHWKVNPKSPLLSEGLAELAGVSYTGGNPLDQYAKMNLAMAKKIPDDYKQAVKILKIRISKLKKMREDMLDTDR